eukprot:3298080-Pleurochrysis_carterae.AAC.7
MSRKGKCAEGRDEQEHVGEEKAQESTRAERVGHTHAYTQSERARERESERAREQEKKTAA